MSRFSDDPEFRFSDLDPSDQEELREAAHALAAELGLEDLPLEDLDPAFELIERAAREQLAEDPAAAAAFRERVLRRLPGGFR